MEKLGLKDANQPKLKLYFVTAGEQFDKFSTQRFVNPPRKEHKKGAAAADVSWVPSRVEQWVLDMDHAAVKQGTNA